MLRSTWLSAAKWMIASTPPASSYREFWALASRSPLSCPIRQVVFEGERQGRHEANQ